MEAIVEAAAACLMLIIEMLIQLVVAVAEVIAWVLVWICAPFWSEEKKNAGLSEKSKQAIKRLATVGLLIAFGFLCWWGWNLLSPKEVPPDPPPAIQVEEAKNAAKRLWNELKKEIEERKGSPP